MSYTHLSICDRACIYHQQTMWSQAEIGRRIKRHRGTIGRELKRYRKHPSWPYYHEYDPQGAQELAKEQRSKLRGFQWTKSRALVAYVIKGLRQEWSPEQISGRLKKVLNKRTPGDCVPMCVSHQSIYRYIKADRNAGGRLWSYLRQSHKKRRKTYGSGPRKSRIPDRVGIAKRPKAAQSRRQSGHWEGDTMLGKAGRLGTVVERKSRYVIISLLPDGTACAFNKGAFSHFKKIPHRQRKTLTTDNGSEFVAHKNLSGRLGFKIYFARPYASWERGTNENTNGLIRQYFPKRCDFSQVTYQRVAKIEQRLNNRPRKCLGYKTPAEVLGPLLRL